MEELKDLIDYDKLKEEREAREKANAESWHEYNEKLNREHNRLGKALIEEYEKHKQEEDDKLKAQMEAKIEEAKREAEERIKEKYKASHRREWNENDTDRALRELARGLFKNDN